MARTDKTLSLSAQIPTQVAPVATNDEASTVLAGALDAELVAAQVKARVDAEQQRCIDLIAMVTMRGETYAARLHPTDMADAMVWLIERGYTCQDAPTFEERVNDPLLS